MPIGYEEAMAIGSREEKPNIAVLEFYTEYIQDNDDPAKTKAIDRVKWVKKGDAHQSTTSERISRLKHDRILWPYIEPMYEAWKKGQEFIPDGTPLEAWNGLSKEEVLHLKASFNIHTIEEFAEMGESAINRCKIMALRTKIQKAQAYITAKSNTAEVQRELTVRDKEIKNLNTANEQLREQLDTMREEIERLKNSEPAQAPWIKPKTK